MGKWGCMGKDRESPGKLPVKLWTRMAKVSSYLPQIVFLFNCCREIKFTVVSVLFPNTIVWLVFIVYFLPVNFPSNSTYYNFRRTWPNQIEPNLLWMIYFVLPGALPANLGGLGRPDDFKYLHLYGVVKWYIFIFSKIHHMNGEHEEHSGHPLYLWHAYCCWIFSSAITLPHSPIWFSLIWWAGRKIA